jgi:hypothetical protein
MLDNCSKHFAMTASILEPTVVILQGALVAKSVATILKPEQSHGKYLHETQLGEQRMLVCWFSHPSAHGALRWGDQPQSPYMTEVVAPTLPAALRQL